MRRTTGWLCVGGAALLFSIPLMAGGGSTVIQLPIGVWLDAQPPEAVTAWHDPATHRNLSLDGFGKRAEWFGVHGLGTTFEGIVTVRVLRDEARVSVLLHTRNAICWGYQGDESETTESYQPAFGNAPYLVAQGEPPSLGEGVFRIEFVVPWPPPEDRMPAYSEIRHDDPTYRLIGLSQVVNCSGMLWDASGYPDGTPGIARTTQIGLWQTGFPGGCVPEVDANCYPSERIDWWPTGPR